MNIKPIKSEENYQAVLERISQLWGAELGSVEGDELEVLMVLAEVYEEKHYVMPESDPVHAVKFIMDKEGLKQGDLVQYLGSDSRVSEFLNRKRDLTLNQIVKLHKGFKIPYECLIQA